MTFLINLVWALYLILKYIINCVNGLLIFINKLVKCEICVNYIFAFRKQL